MKQTSAIVFEAVDFAYDEQSPIFQNFNLSIEKGSMVAIIGGNGSGKSTLARLINGLLLPQAGTVCTFGYTTTMKDTLPALRSNVGLVFQDPDDQMVASIVEDEVAFGPANMGVDAPEIRQRVAMSLQQVGLKGFENHNTQELSGGQKQRVAIAGALACRPKLLILDEASVMLDPASLASLQTLCLDLHRKGMTIINITHSMEEAAACERVIALSHGAIVLDGAPKEVLTQKAVLESIDLAAPYPVEFAHKLQKAGVFVQPCLTLDDLEEELWALNFAT